MFAGLPGSENAKIPNIHVLCCSNVLSAMDMTEPIAQGLQWNQQPHHFFKTTSKSLAKVCFAYFMQRLYHNNHWMTPFNHISGFSGNSHWNLIQSRHFIWLVPRLQMGPSEVWGRAKTATAWGFSERNVPICRSPPSLLAVLGIIRFGKVCLPS